MTDNYSIDYFLFSNSDSTVYLENLDFGFYLDLDVFYVLDFIELSLFKDYFSKGKGYIVDYNC